jgi:hypothetical protein
MEFKSKIGRDPSERPAPREPRYHTQQFLQRATTTAPRDDDDDFDAPGMAEARAVKDKSTRPDDDRGAARKGRPFWRSYFTIGQQRWLDQHQRQSHIHAIGDRWPDTLATQRPPH